MKEKNKEIKLEFINDARVVLLGIAALMVTFFHTQELNYHELINIPLIGNLINFIQKIGNCGVDIFLFLSGIGLYLSMTKNTVGKYYKNRFIKIIPKYIIILIIYSFFVEEMTGLKIIETLFGLSFFVDGIRDGWYIAFIMFLYLIFPIIYKLLKKYDVFALFVILLLVVLLNFCLSYWLPVYYFKIEVGLTRIPVFLVGVFFGKKIHEGYKISLRMIKYSFIIQVIVLFILYLNIDLTYLAVFSRYLYCPLAICLAINISWLYYLLKNKDNLLLKPIMFFGNHSLEMYLIFEKTCYVLVNIYLMDSYIEIYLLGFVITLVLSYILNKVFNVIVLKLDNLFNVRRYV